MKPLPTWRCAPTPLLLRLEDDLPFAPFAHGPPEGASVTAAPSAAGRAPKNAHKLAGLPIPTDDERVRATVLGIRPPLDAAPSNARHSETEDRIANGERQIAKQPKLVGIALASTSCRLSARARVSSARHGGERI
jgi:hypothetical protein